MRKLFPRAARLAAGWTLLLSAGMLLSSCMLAAAGAGAGGAIYVTSRGAESLVDANVDEVADATREAFDEFDIRQTGTTSEEEGEEREIRGDKGDLDVTVHFERQSPSTTKVEVTARKNVAEWDRDFAKQVLQAIVKRS